MNCARSAQKKFVREDLIIRGGGLIFSEGYQRYLAIGVNSYVRTYVRNKFFQTHIRQLLDPVGR